MFIAQIGYISLSILVIFLILKTYHKGLLRAKYSPGKAGLNTVILGVVFMVWVSYLTFLGQSGWLWNFDLPPRFPLLIFLPLLITMVIIFFLNRKSPLFETIPRENVLYFQSFRVLVELVILATYVEGVFPIETTFEGYNYEIVIGAAAPLVAYGAYHKKWFSERVVMLFNILGLITLSIIIFIVVSSLYAPEIWGEAEPRINPVFAKMPYLLLPGILAPAAIFAHVFSIIQIRKSQKTD